MIEMKPIELHQTESVKQIMLAVCQELFQVSEEELAHHFSSDLDDVQAHYFDDNGIFLVLTDDDKVVGSGAIQRLNNDICELKRMYFLREYRGQGLGFKMTQMLLDFAREAGYKKVRLDTREEMKQALKLYKRLGFYAIESYTDSLCNVFLEKIL